MVKILSRSGDSLADTYDVQGSIAGIDQLLTQELPIVHEMGATIFSERFSIAVRHGSSGALAQSLDFESVTTNLPESTTRLLGVSVFAPQGEAADFVRASLALHDPDAGQDFPFWLWDGTNSVVTRLEDSGDAVAFVDLLTPSAPFTQLPQFASGRGFQRQSLPDLVFRGTTGAFGAGTATLTVIYLLAFTHVGGISSRGLPIPSW